MNDRRLPATTAIAAALLALCPVPAAAQGHAQPQAQAQAKVQAQVPAGSRVSTTFGGASDPRGPVEVTAEKLQVNQRDGKATFSGSVVVRQGDMRLAAQEVSVIYAGDARDRIQAFTASGGVTLVSGNDAAEAERARYDVGAGLVTLSGKALVVRGDNVLSGEQMVIDLATGSAEVQGGVRGVLAPEAQ